MLFRLLFIAAFLALLILTVTYICFRIVFYVPKKQNLSSDELPVPEGAIYEPYHPIMKKWILEARNFPQEDCYITSHDGLKLHAKYFEYKKGAVTEIMFHGYRGSAERDLSGGIQRCFALGRNVLLIDQRTSCGSEGNVISFGINEHKDCLAWIDFAVKKFGPDVKRLAELEYIIDAQFMTKLNREAVAEKLFISTRQLDRICKKRYGKTFHEQLTERRMATAIAMLKDTDMTAEEISHAVGFLSSSNFYKAFTEKFEMTPYQYRKNLNCR
ncbi:MAG: helix-turn-helix transcriptional regulator [Christensenellaceae bacterium]|nr:helix-turn-helix transcriptional regulator [Christensenellaceae bacterium]